MEVVEQPGGDARRCADGIDGESEDLRLVGDHLRDAEAVLGGVDARDLAAGEPSKSDAVQASGARRRVP